MAVLEMYVTDFLYFVSVGSSLPNLQRKMELFDRLSQPRPHSSTKAMAAGLKGIRSFWADHGRMKEE